jgi:hypothetical protein
LKRLGNIGFVPLFQQKRDRAKSDAAKLGGKRGQSAGRKKPAKHFETRSFFQNPVFCSFFSLFISIYL